MLKEYRKLFCHLKHISENILKTHLFYSNLKILSVAIFTGLVKKDEKVFVVAADCTGHGVPGALMSMIGLEIVEKTINEDNIEIPSQDSGGHEQRTWKKHSAGKKILEQLSGMVWI